MHQQDAKAAPCAMAQDAGPADAPDTRAPPLRLARMEALPRRRPARVAAAPYRF